MAEPSKRTNGINSCALAFWDDDGDRGTKIQLDYFLGENGVDVCLLMKTHLKSDEVNLISHQRETKPFLSGRGADR